METLVQKYDKLRREVLYVKVLSKNQCEELAMAKFSDISLTVSERKEKVKSEMLRLIDANIAENKNYWNKINEIDKAWQQELFEEFDVVGNPKAQKCYSIAYEFGNSSGYNDIYCYFSEIVELIK